MNNNKLYPFERNRYYAGKMLTSADFQAEQTYFNNKRRFLNSVMYGAGIVCGLGVFSLDDLSILVESGVAIDGMGREIVIDSSVVKKLSAIDGFDNLRSSDVSLCLSYEEKEVHTVYSVNQTNSDKNYEFNRIAEGYRLFLMDKEDIPLSFEMESEFLVKGVLFEDSNFKVDFLMPATVCRGKQVKAVVRVTKLSMADVKLSYRSTLQIPAFNAPDGSHEIEIDIDNLLLEAGKSADYDFWMMTQDIPAPETNIILKSGSVSAAENGEAVMAPANFTIRVLLSNTLPRDLVNTEIGKVNLEMKGIGSQGDYIRLADISLVRTDQAYIIEELTEASVKHYIMSPSQEMLREIYMDFFIKNADITQQAVVSAPVMSEQPKMKAEPQTPQIATGVLEIPLQENPRKGEIYYSGEIMHGLGKGNVYVDVGYEFINEDTTISSSAKSTIFGNPELFDGEQRNVVNAETAIRVLNDKGSFIVAAKLLENVDFLMLTYRWVAIKFPAGNDLELMEETGGKSISAVTPTVVLGTKESHFFGVEYHNMDAVSIAYELTEPNSGEITADGIYTAPNKEGVYEISIYCTDMPLICTYAYAIVKKKGLE
ncbi:MAG: hypothetical protein IJT72_10795 [Lachnospiraceae bacterium]|nr:hypothetical protein [Lachnospiraceae bacterium]